MVSKSTVRERMWKTRVRRAKFEEDCEIYMITQQLLLCCGAYGSSLRSTDPHIDGTMKSFVFVQYCMSDMEASETLIRGRSRSSFSRVLSSFNRRSFRSAMLCFFDFPASAARIS